MKGVICIKIGLKNLRSRLEFLFSHVFDGIVWNTLISGKSSLLLLEIRNPEKKKTTFAAFDFTSNQLLWDSLTFEEPWWINLSAVEGDIAFFTVYTETNNPDQKSLLAYRLSTRSIIWWQNDFSLVSVSEKGVTGYSHKFGLKELYLDIESGRVVAAGNELPQQNLLAIRPFHYRAGEKEFETVKTFLRKIVRQEAELGIDYLETDRFIFISCYVRETGLANYLIVLSLDGEVLLNEKAGENLKGIGIDTFFLLEGSLFFVKNKCELVRYKLI
jgi:hypothetical protein